ncbi:MAG TPA: DNA polymerase domain-containing protein [Anaerolineales bacterium]|nr:DNA polymerase domain-containing protein [Anaerolineales bacterium]
MKEYTGWLFDLYAQSEGIVLWIIGEDHKPHCLTQPFAISFYAGGPFHRLRQLWRFLKERPVRLYRTERRDLHEGMKDVLEVSVHNPSMFDGLFREVNRCFPDLLYYDVDIPLILRYAARYGVFPAARCKVEIEQGWKLANIAPLDTPWELDPELPDLRILQIRPDTNLSHAEPKSLSIHFDRFRYCLPLNDPRKVLSCLNAVLRQQDPDVILTGYGDTWLFSYLEEVAKQTGIPFNPNRDPAQSIRRKKEISFHNYGRSHFRGEQVHLFGRWHIDDRNCMTFGDYGLTGAIEQARVTGLPVQEIARRSPGAGIAAMQTLTALKRGVLVPYQQQKGEVPKTYNELVVSDRGGLVFEPLSGVFPHVAIIDFMSMYPSIIVEFNISPETVGVEEEDALSIPEMGVRLSSGEGLVPAALRRMVEKRVKIKKRLKGMDKSDPLYSRYKAYANALKWLCVVAYGRLGFANSTFGRINSHEVVSFISRKMLLKAKEIAEDHGFTVVHAYVDSLFICKPGAIKEEDFQPLLKEIREETKLPIEVEEVYSWMAFVSSRQNPHLSVPNRFFGLQSDGGYKIRGLASRRDDTPLFVANAQLEILQILAKEKDPGRLTKLLPEVLSMLQETMLALSHRKVPVGELLVTQTLSRELNGYRVLSPVARAAKQLQAVGKNVRMGQRVQFIYTRTKEGVQAWGLPAPFRDALIDTVKYKELLFRAAHEVLQPLGVTESVLRNWMFCKASYLLPPGMLSPYGSSRLDLPLFAGLRYVLIGPLGTA